ncbi:MAG: transposase [Acidimicrobiales bacterium]
MTTIARRITGGVDIDRILKVLLAETAPELLAVTGVGTDVGTAILVAVGDNPERLKGESTFAHLCGVSPIDASSDKNERHRLNRGGDRSANSALWHIVLTRMVNDPSTGFMKNDPAERGRLRRRWA